MTFDDLELINDFVVESNEHLAEIENQLLEIEANGANINVNLMNEVFRAIHSIKGAAGFLGLTAIGALSHSLENVLNLIRERELTPTKPIVDVMLKTADQLSVLIQDISNSNGVDVSEFSQLLDEIANNLGIPDASVSAKTQMNIESEEHLVSQIAQDIGSLSPATEEDVMDREIRLAFEAREAVMPARKACKSIGVHSDTTATQSVGATDTSKPEAPVQSWISVAPSPPAPVGLKKPANTSQSAREEGSEKAESKQSVESSIQVSVTVLDQLMNLAGELVLARNQLLQTVNNLEKNNDKSASISGLDTVTAGIDQVTSELQVAIMKTRMQPLGSVFNRFPRVVRDLSTKVGKQIDLQLEGSEVEVDKTIVEMIGDPLTHLVRNSVDHGVEHGVEHPDTRLGKGKIAKGLICLRAYHQAGKVRIDIEDDGGGIDPQIIKAKALEKGVVSKDQFQRMNDRDAVRLIFHPGFSTAAQLTDIGGRGVGMDVVKTNIEKLGGTVDVDSTVNVGTIIRVTLPLTLAIVPSLIVQANGDRYAIPQSNIVELVRVRTAELKEKIGHIKNAQVLRLRGNLLPLIRLSDALDLKLVSVVPKGKSDQLEKRDGIESQTPTIDMSRNRTKATNIVVVEATQFRYGLIVDSLHESEEIVVKPLGVHLRESQSLAGATILGDGHIALILDVAGIAAHSNLTSVTEKVKRRNDTADQLAAEKEEVQTALLFTNHPTEQFAIPMSVITRIERTTQSQIDEIGGDLLMRYRDSSLPLLSLHRLLNCKPALESDNMYVVVFEVNKIEIGLIAPELSDIRELQCKIESVASDAVGVMGTFVLENRTTRYLNLFELAEKAHPQWFIERREESELVPQSFKLLLVEDSSFFRRQLRKFITSEGFNMVEAEDGELGWQRLLEENGTIDLVVSDIEMPKMNGFELCTKIRQSGQFNKLPIIALTSLSDPSDIQRGKAVGFNDYQVKMDKENLIRSITQLLKASRQLAKA